MLAHYKFARYSDILVIHFEDSILLDAESCTQKEEERQRENFFTQWFTLQIALTTGAGPAEARARTIIWSPKWVQRPRYLGGLQPLFPGVSVWIGSGTAQSQTGPKWVVGTGC